MAIMNRLSEVLVKQTENEIQKLPLLPIVLGWMGVLPFVIGVVAVYTRQYEDWAMALFVYYGAVILSFLGGIRWAQALSAQLEKVDYVFAIMPSLFAWLCLALPVKLALIGLALGFTAVAYLDILARPLKAPKAFLRLRFGISLCVIGLHFALLGLVWLRI
jgi:hypothetical protein